MDEPLFKDTIQRGPTDAQNITTPNSVVEGTTADDLCSSDTDDDAPMCTISIVESLAISSSKKLNKEDPLNIESQKQEVMIANVLNMKSKNNSSSSSVSSTTKAVVSTSDNVVTLKNQEHIIHQDQQTNGKSTHSANKNKRKSLETVEDEETSDDDDKEWEVEEILSHRKYKGKIEYLVQWAGYSKNDATWEPKGNLVECLQMVNEYHIALLNYNQRNFTGVGSYPKEIPNSTKEQGTETHKKNNTEKIAEHDCADTSEQDENDNISEGVDSEMDELLYKDAILRGKELQIKIQPLKASDITDAFLKTHHIRRTFRERLKMMLSNKNTGPTVPHMVTPASSVVEGSTSETLYTSDTNDDEPMCTISIVESLANSSSKMLNKEDSLNCDSQKGLKEKETFIHRWVEANYIVEAGNICTENTIFQHLKITIEQLGLGYQVTLNQLRKAIRSVFGAFVGHSRCTGTSYSVYWDIGLVPSYQGKSIVIPNSTSCEPPTTPLTVPSSAANVTSVPAKCPTDEQIVTTPNSAVECSTVDAPCSSDTDDDAPMCTISTVESLAISSSKKLNKENPLNIESQKEENKKSLENTAFNQQHSQGFKAKPNQFIDPSATKCFCGRFGNWYDRMLECQRCKHWFHETCVGCLHYKLICGDRFYLYVCELCNNGMEFLHRLPINWMNIVHLALWNLSNSKRLSGKMYKYFDYQKEIAPWVNDHWELLQCRPELRCIPINKRTQYILLALEGNSNKFKSGKEVSKKKSLWGLKIRDPPLVAEIILPPDSPITEALMNRITYCERRTKLPPIPKTFKIDDAEPAIQIHMKPQEEPPSGVDLHNEDDNKDLTSKCNNTPDPSIGPSVKRGRMKQARVKQARVKPALVKQALKQAQVQRAQVKRPPKNSKYSSRVTAAAAAAVATMTKKVSSQNKEAQVAPIAEVLSSAVIQGEVSQQPCSGTPAVQNGPDVHNAMATLPIQAVCISRDGIFQIVLPQNEKVQVAPIAKVLSSTVFQEEVSQQPSSGTPAVQNVPDVQNAMTSATLPIQIVSAQDEEAQVAPIAEVLSSTVSQQSSSGTPDVQNVTGVQNNMATLPIRAEYPEIPLSPTFKQDNYAAATAIQELPTVAPIAKVMSSAVFQGVVSQQPPSGTPAVQNVTGVQNDMVTLPIQAEYPEIPLSPNFKQDNDAAATSIQNLPAVAYSQSPQNISIHMNLNSGEQDIKCTECDYTTNIRDNLKNHMLDHSGERMKNHMLNQPGRKLLHCKYCDYKSIRSDKLHLHTMIHTGEKLYACKICDYKCNKIVKLSAHMKGHKRVKPFACQICNYCSATGEELKYHMMKHTGRKTIKCTLCEYRCTSNDNLKMHMLKHTGDNPFSCQICGYHNYSHSGDKPSKCQLCDYKIITNEKLKPNKITNTGEELYGCLFCEFRCATTDKLKIHTMLHAVNKSFECLICDIKCTTSEKLKIHMLTHTVKKTFACKDCEFRCTRKDSLKIHMIAHRMEEKQVGKTASNFSDQKAHLGHQIHKSEFPTSQNTHNLTAVVNETVNAINIKIPKNTILIINSGTLQGSSSQNGHSRALTSQQIINLKTLQSNTSHQQHKPQFAVPQQVVNNATQSSQQHFSQTSNNTQGIHQTSLLTSQITVPQHQQQTFTVTSAPTQQPVVVSPLSPPLYQETWQPQQSNSITTTSTHQTTTQTITPSTVTGSQYQAGLNNQQRLHQDIRDPDQGRGLVVSSTVQIPDVNCSKTTMARPQCDQSEEEYDGGLKDTKDMINDVSTAIVPTFQPTQILLLDPTQHSND